MSRFQAVLALILATLVAILFGRTAWTVLTPTVAAVPALVGAVPTWVWWTAFGIGTGLLKMVFFHRLGWSCGSCASRPSTS